MHMIILRDTKEFRAELVNYVTALSEEELQRTGQHPLHGALTIPDWITFFLLHESHHQYTIFRLVHADGA